MQHGVNVPQPPKARSAEAHLEGMGTVIMLKMRQRIIERLEQTDTYFWLSYGNPGMAVGQAIRHISQGEGAVFLAVFEDPNTTARNRAEFADWMIRRMAQNRLKQGLEMDSIVAASYKAFLPNLMAQALKTVQPKGE